MMKQIEKKLIKSYENIIKIIEELGYDVKDGNFKDTAKRCSKAFLREFIWDRKKIEGESKKLLIRTFKPKVKYDEIIVQTNIPIILLCPHHLLPVENLITVGYIPNEVVLGLSKIARLAIVLGKQPILQESYTKQLSNCLFKNLSPLGVGVYVKGKHGCMRYRGVKLEQTETITTSLEGNFKTNMATKSEFLRYCR